MLNKSNMTLDKWDYVSMALMLILSVSAGFYHVFKANSKSSTQQFLMTDKNIGFIPIVMSSVATAISAMSIQGYPLECYINGVQFVFLSFPFLVCPIIYSWIFLPVYYDLGISSVFQYLEYRFNRFIRLMASFLNTTQMVLTSSIMIYASGLALNQVTGLDLWPAVLSIGVVCTVYTALGGIKAVIWADAFQLVVILLAVIFIMVKGAIDVGGVTEVWRRVSEGDRLHIYFVPDPLVKETIWTYLIGGTLFFICLLPVNQMYQQRILSNTDVKKAKKCIQLMAAISAVIIIIFSLTGLTMYAKYWDCDPLLSGIITSRDQMVPLFAVETLFVVKGLSGFFVAAVLCATLSTFSSLLNSLAAVSLVDYILPFWTNISEKQSKCCSKLLAIMYGILCVAFTVVAENMGGVVRAVYSILGIVSGPLFTLFVVGILFPWTNNIGAFAGFLVSLTCGVWITVGSLIMSPKFPTAPLTTAGCNLTAPWLPLISNGSHNLIEKSVIANFDSDIIVDISLMYIYTLSPLWYPSLTASLGIISAVIVTFCSGARNPDDVDPKLLSPLARNLFRNIHLKCRTCLSYKSKETATHQWNTQVIFTVDKEVMRIQTTCPALHIEKSIITAETKAIINEAQ